MNVNIINEIREKQNQIIEMINTTFDELVEKAESISTGDFETERKYERIYPLTNKTGFKGSKPLAVKLGENRIITPTWKTVVEVILKDAIKDEQKKNDMYSLCDVLVARKRNRLAKTKDSMRSPLKICDDLFVETHYDTESLIKLLLEILDNIGYDYNNIRIIIKNK